MNRRSFIAGLFAAAVVPAVKAADVLALCEGVQRFVNLKLRYRSDMEIHGVHHRVESVAQAYARGFGDCEEFALCYRHELIAQGLDAKRIKICWCRVNGEAHCICLVDDLYVIDTTLMSSVREISRRPDITNIRQYAGLDESGLVYAIANAIPVATN